jgi:hypothetical protein
MAIKGREVLPQITEIEEVVNAPQQVLLRDVLFEAERIEQTLLRAALHPHHRPTLLIRISSI